MSDKITREDFFKSLERLDALAKGVEPEDDLKKAQICTGPGHEPQSWPGGDKTEYGEGWDDNIHADGTDYTGPGSKARKSIADKIMKGEPLTESEVAILKGDYGKDEDDEDEKRGKEKGGKDEDDEDEKKLPPFMGKSFEDQVRESETLQKGIEVSDFLAELTRATGLALQGMEGRIVKSVTDHIIGALQQVYDEQGEFNKSLAEAVANIGHGVGAVIDWQGETQEQPTGPPRSQLRSVPGGGQQPQVLSKGVGGGLESMSKAQILDQMSDLVTKGKMNPLDVIKFEATNELTPQVQDTLVKSFAAGQ